MRCAVPSNVTNCRLSLVHALVQRATQDAGLASGGSSETDFATYPNPLPYDVTLRSPPTLHLPDATADHRSVLPALHLLDNPHESSTIPQQAPWAQPADPPFPLAGPQTPRPRPTTTPSSCPPTAAPPPRRPASVVSGEARRGPSCSSRARRRTLPRRSPPPSQWTGSGPHPSALLLDHPGRMTTTAWWWRPRNSRGLLARLLLSMSPASSARVCRGVPSAGRAARVRLLAAASR